MTTWLSNFTQPHKFKSNRKGSLFCLTIQTEIHACLLVVWKGPCVPLVLWPGGCSSLIFQAWATCPPESGDGADMSWICGQGGGGGVSRENARGRDNVQTSATVELFLRVLLLSGYWWGFSVLCRVLKALTNAYYSKIFPPFSVKGVLPPSISHVFFIGGFLVLQFSDYCIVWYWPY